MRAEDERRRQLHAMANLMVRLELSARHAAERGDLSYANELIAQRERVATHRSQLLLEQFEARPAVR